MFLNRKGDAMSGLETGVKVGKIASALSQLKSLADSVHGVTSAQSGHNNSLVLMHEAFQTGIKAATLGFPNSMPSKTSFNNDEHSNQPATYYRGIPFHQQSVHDAKQSLSSSAIRRFTSHNQRERCSMNYSGHQHPRLTVIRRSLT